MIDVDPCSETFEDVRRLIHSVVNRFRRKYGMGEDPEELFAEASFHFMEAYNAFDYKKGDFSKRVSFVVWNRLLTKKKRTAKKLRIMQRTDDDVDGFSDTPAFDLNRFSGQGDDDVRTVVNLSISLAGGRFNPQHTRDALVKVLVQEGWSGRRITGAFRNIREMLE